jgi:signal transduction histidine kinase
MILGSAARPMPPAMDRSTVKAMERLTSLARRYWFDAFVIACAVAAAIELVVRRNEDSAPQSSLWLLVPLAVIGILPLLGYRRFPFAAPAAVFLVGALTSFVDGDLVTFAGGTFFIVLAASFVFGLLPEWRQAVAGLALTLVAGGIVTYNDPAQTFEDYFGIALLFLVLWLAGFGLGRKLQEVADVREQAARLESEREQQAREAVAEERARLARELHDVVGHSVSVMTVQASAVRRLLLPEQEKEREALEIVEQTGRQALAEMRRLVGVLRRPEESPALAPQPSLEHIEKLVAQVRESGLPVELRVEGEPAQLPAGLDLTAYRFVQEGLTNALKHARADQAQVLVRYGDGEIELEVSDNGTGGGDGAGGGHGLVGMRERVAVYGGELEAAPRPEGGFRLKARLPLEAT